MAAYVKAQGSLLPTTMFEAKATSNVSYFRQGSSQVIEFPLKPFSNDFKGDRDGNASEHITEDFKRYLKLLEIVSSPVAGDDVDLSEFKVVELINKLDQTQHCSLLHYASMNGHLQIAHFLIENGANVDIWDGEKKVTPLICASAFGNLDMVKFLIERNCTIDAGLNSQSSALFWAVRLGHKDIVRCLLENKAQQNSTVPFSETAVHAAIGSGQCEILGLLIDFLGNIPADFPMGPEKDTPLHIACSTGCRNGAQSCKILLQHGGVNSNSRKSKNLTPMHVAAAAKNTEIVDALLAQWANPNMVDDDGRTPLFYAIGDADDAINCMRVLIDKAKCDVNHQDNKGYTPLHEAGIIGGGHAAELLLLNGADFSIRTTTNNTPALSILRRKIANIDEILKKTFDTAVTVTNPHPEGAPPEGRTECKVRVNYKYVLPSGGPEHPHNTALDEEADEKPSRWARMASTLKGCKRQSTKSTKTRKETAKLKCLVDEGLTNLLLHPVIHSFIEMKWHKSRVILFPTLALKIILVLLFSAYVQIPFMWGSTRALVPELNCTSPTPDTMSRNFTGVVVPPVNRLRNATIVLEEVPQTTPSPAAEKPTCTSQRKGTAPKWFLGIYIAIISLAAVKIATDVFYIMRSPKSLLNTIGPWLSLGVVLIIVFYMRPDSWQMASRRIDRSMAALAILLAWVDVWITMSRFPQWGLSIRVFMQVFKNFLRFISPHICLFLGFLFSLTLIFPDNNEFYSLGFTASKMIRIIAGDITIVTEGQRRFTPNDDRTEVAAHFLLVYIYTAYIMIVAIVLANLLIGLAVNDIQGIYAEASIDKLVKQTRLLNAAESGFHGKWLRSLIPVRFLENHIYLFKPTSPSKVLTFKPFDQSDTQLSSEHKRALLNISNDVEMDGEVTRGKKRSIDSSKKQLHKNAQSWQDVMGKLKLKKERRSSIDEQKILMENINKLIQSYLADKPQE